VVETDWTDETGEALIRDTSMSATNMHRELKITKEARAAKVAEIVCNSDGPCVIWVNTDYDAQSIKSLLTHAVEVKGSDSSEIKEKRLNDFSEGRIQLLLTKPSIAGWGMNWQHCQHQVFTGISYSYEQFYQAARRLWRFGQQREVHTHIVIAETEGAVLETIHRKQLDHQTMKTQMQVAMNETRLQDRKRAILMEKQGFETVTGNNWTLHNGDSCEIIKTLPDNSIGFSVFSPPFEGLYIYSDSVRDMGNCDSSEEFFTHFKFLIRELLRVTLPGRLAAVHCKDLPMYKGRDGAAGLRDFPGQIVRAFEECGWTFHSRVTIWKDPVIEMQRTKNHGLLYKNVRENSCVSRQGMADYMIVFRKWEPDMESLNINPVQHTRDEFTLDQWQKWASPVWMDINQTNVLNKEMAREGEDERHICPLQLDVIERSLVLWSNPGDVVFSPFAGIGSECVMSLRKNRKFIGCELKKSYFDVACRYLKEAEQSTIALDLFSDNGM
jgi:DNA modification methylase